MQKDLRSYVKVYKNLIGNDVCRSSVKLLEKVKWEDHKFYNSHESSYQSLEKDFTVHYNEIPTSQQLMKSVWQGLERYIIKDFNFNWFSGWNGYSKIRFNRYTQNTQMASHCDHIHDLFDGSIRGIPILSIVGVLNDNYKGGEFVMFGDEVIELGAGDLMVFPSVFTYPHHVNEVTEGTRYSFVSWAY